MIRQGIEYVYHSFYTFRLFLYQATTRPAEDWGEAAAIAGGTNFSNVCESDDADGHGRSQPWFFLANTKEIPK